MSKNSDKNNNQPLDDLGIKNDQIINCAEKIVDDIWIRLNGKTPSDISATDLHAYSSTLCNVWSLVRNMMEFLEDSYDQEIDSIDDKSMENFYDDDDDDDDDDGGEDDEDDMNESKDK